ncbi:MAG TPA: alpha/beta hydrolase [Baekduia sp.]|jgi:monoterpene epsilon-lactone hydrolase
MPSAELERAREWERAFGEANASAGGLEEVRLVNDQWQAERAGELPVDLEFTAVDAGGVPAEWISVAGAAATPVILFLHGGGFMLGSARENREWIGRLVRELGGRALAIDYRLAPEHPYPAQVEDARTAYRWLLAQGIAPADLLVLGESAGGGLAAATLTAIRDGGDPLPAAAALTSPLVDFTLGAASLDDNDDPFVNRPVLEMMIQTALQGQDSEALSPLSHDLAGLPPLLIQVGTSEAIRDDGRRYADAASAAGVAVSFEQWDGMVHLWHGFPYLPEAVDAVERIAAFFAEYTGGEA